MAVPVFKSIEESGGKGNREKVRREKMDKEIKEKLDNILFEIRWMQRNMNPPVDYTLIVICSVIASAITTYVMSKI